MKRSILHWKYVFRLIFLFNLYGVFYWHSLIFCEVVFLWHKYEFSCVEFLVFIVLLLFLNWILISFCFVRLKILCVGWFLLQFVIGWTMICLWILSYVLSLGYVIWYVCYGTICVVKFFQVCVVVHWLVRYL